VAPRLQVILVMNRVLLLASIFGPAIVISLSFWIARSARAVHAQERTSSGQVVVPSGTKIRVRLVQGVTAGTRIGENLQTLTAEATLQDKQVLIPEQTRALVEVLDVHKEKPDLAHVTMQLNELIFKDRNVRVRSAPITARVDRLTDLDLATRALGGLIGGAVGAAGGAAARANPDVGATAIGGLAAGAPNEPDQERVLVFQILEPIDLTGIRW
jgi:head-tail adaptor